MLTTVDADGHLTARPMAQQEVEFDGDLWFFVEHRLPHHDEPRRATRRPGCR